MQLKSGILFNIQHFCVHDGPGIRTTVFFKGCPLKCIWCQNPEGITTEFDSNNLSTTPPTDETISHEKLFNGQSLTIDVVSAIIKKDYLFYEESGGGATFSGGEPMMQHLFLLELLKFCKENNINTAVDTSGYTAYNKFEIIAPFTDMFLYDLKIVNETDHIRYTGVSNKLILNNLKRLNKTGKTINIRIPLIPGITDTSVNIDEIIEFVSSLNDINVSLIPYNNYCISKYKKMNITYRLQSLVPQSEEVLSLIQSKFLNAGIPANIRG